MTAQLPKDIDRPNPFTKRAIGSTAAKAGGFTAEMFVKRQQAEYLARLVFGGARTPLRRFVFVPAKTEQTNAYGNMSRTRRRRVLGSASLVVKRVGAKRLAFQRRGKTLTYVGVFSPRTFYPRPRFRFYEHAHTFAARDVNLAFNLAWAKRFAR